MRSLFVQLPNFDMLVRCYTPGEVKQVNYIVTPTVGNTKDAWKKEVIEGAISWNVLIL